MNNNYRLYIKDYHSIGKADIVINGITILAGENGCGKSTIERWLYYVINGMCEFDNYKKYELVEFMRHILFTMMRFMPNKETLLARNKRIMDWYYHNIEDLSMGIIIAEEMLHDCENDMHHFIDDCPTDRLRERALRSMMDEQIDFSLGYHQAVITLFDKFQDRMDTISRYLRMALSSRKLSDLNRMIFDRYEVRNDMPKEFRIYEDNDSLIEDGRFSRPFMLDKVIYIDSPMVLSDNVEEPSAIWKDFLFLLTPKAQLMNTATQKLYTKICHIINGRITSKEKFGHEELHYESMDGLDIRIEDTATGIKTFAYILQLLANGHLNSHTILVIDEPEAHLHPQWIVELSRILLLLHKGLGVKIIIATHNPDMVSAIKSIGEAYKLDEKVDFYIANKDSLSGKYYYESLGFEIDKIFGSFNIALDRIDLYGSYSGKNNSIY